MPFTTRLDVFNAILKVGVIPIFYHSNYETARQAVEACAEGGAPLVEYTNRGPGALGVFTALVEHFAKSRPKLILGAGSILDPATAALFMAAGADFIVGSVFNPEVARLCNRHKTAYIPGCATPGEISRAEEWGCEIIKIFPGDTIGGPKFVKAVLGPTPWSRLMPTGGVEPTRESLAAWFDAGVCAVGIGSNLLRKDWLEAGDYASISALTARVIAWAAELRRVEV